MEDLDFNFIMKPAKQFLFAACRRLAHASGGFFIACMPALAVFLPLQLSGQEFEGETLVEVSLISDSSTLVPGQPVTVGLHMKMAPGWHTYWKHGGDSGLATNIEWDLPEGIQASEIHWPLPIRVKEPGDMEVYAYKDEVVLLTRFFPSPDLAGEEIVIRARADWLVCEAICIPGDADLTLTLDIGEEKVPDNTELIARYRDKLPVRIDAASGMEARWERQEDDLYLLLRNVPEDVVVDFYPLPDEGVLVGHAKPVDSWEGSGEFSPDRVLTIPVRFGPGELTSLVGVLVAHPADDSADRKGWVIRPSFLRHQASR